MEKLILWIFVCEVFEVEILLALCSPRTFWQLTVSNHWSNKTYGYSMFTWGGRGGKGMILFQRNCWFSPVNFDLPLMAQVNSPRVSIAQSGSSSTGLSFSVFPDRCHSTFRSLTMIRTSSFWHLRCPIPNFLFLKIELSPLSSCETSASFCHFGKTSQFTKPSFWALAATEVFLSVWTYPEALADLRTFPRAWIPHFWPFKPFGWLLSHAWVDIKSKCMKTKSRLCTLG